MARNEKQPKAQTAFVIGPDGKMRLPDKPEDKSTKPTDPREDWAKPTGWLERTIKGGGADVTRIGAGHASNKFE